MCQQPCRFHEFEILAIHGIDPAHTGPGEVNILFIQDIEEFNNTFRIDGKGIVHKGNFSNMIMIPQEFDFRSDVFRTALTQPLTKDRAVTEGALVGTTSGWL
ncbi:MAG: hypothetical protein MZV49_25670 [Rhodopseudomonas palustris]|nr:hypothetical protein [Rhodopseudomonas palustris]